MKIGSARSKALCFRWGLVGCFLLMVSAMWWTWQRKRLPPLAQAAQAVVQLDLMAPSDYGWISDHELFFLREKNQGDFLCFKIDIRDGQETVMDALSPYLQDKEDRGATFFMQSSPSGRNIAMAFGDRKQPDWYLHRLDDATTLEMPSVNKVSYHLTWLEDESGWMHWEFKQTPGSGAETGIPVRCSPEGGAVPLQAISLDGSSMTRPYFAGPHRIAFPTKSPRNLHLQLETFSLDADQEDMSITSGKTYTIASDIRHGHSFMDASQDGTRWLTAFMTASRVPRVARFPEFPFFKFQTKFRFQIRLWSLEHQESASLCVDFGHAFGSGPRFPYDFQLNPSGTHFSFVHQGKIWVARIEDLLP